jgi:hypothetical protein
MACNKQTHPVYVFPTAAIKENTKRYVNTTTEIHERETSHSLPRVLFPFMAFINQPTVLVASERCNYSTYSIRRHLR